MAFFHQAFLRAVRAFGVALVAALLLDVLGNIVCREAFGIALVWANETAITLFVWIAFVGAGISFAENARIRFTFLVDKLPGRARAAFEVVVTYVGLALLAGFIATSLYVSYVHRNETFTTIPLTVVWEWAALPVGMLVALEGWIRHGTWMLSQARRPDPIKLAGT